MKQLFLSITTMTLVAVLAIGATTAAFTSRATVENNTFATGSLEIRINGSSSIPGFTVTNAMPGTCQSGQFTVNNYGAPWFAGPSTVPAETLTVSALQDGGSTPLFNDLQITVEANRGWPTRMAVYSGALSGLSTSDLLTPRWTQLAPGDSEDVFYNVCLPADSSVQGSTTFDFIVDASST